MIDGVSKPHKMVFPNGKTVYPSFQVFHSFVEHSTGIPSVILTEDMPHLASVAGAADTAAFISAIDSRLHKRKYGWLYYLHNVGII